MISAVLCQYVPLWDIIYQPTLKSRRSHRLHFHVRLENGLEVLLVQYFLLRHHNALVVGDEHEQHNLYDPRNHAYKVGGNDDVVPDDEPVAEREERPNEVRQRNLRRHGRSALVLHDFPDGEKGRDVGEGLD
ncbi:PRC-barrel domain containing protein [Babesia caballi]|uniref:PRC-barrel domain containing protein n=1 Tax=Babesia caballi TaxID=5871 RepID=A0AAV4M2W0_BABCB|nr:PRC-barrel domain containing protein [Babesia caballi]